MFAQLPALKRLAMEPTVDLIMLKASSSTANWPASRVVDILHNVLSTRRTGLMLAILGASDPCCRFLLLQKVDD